jgi:uncharacterized YigZ family protein
MKDLYRTIASPSEGQFKDKGSRFLAFAYPVDHEQGIRQLVDDLKKQYHDARHHCYAWQLGAGLDRFRVNDDGEPPGSAGKPIHGQILARELTQILVVVVRYFGGTLLGVGGLINAYRSAAAQALDRAVIVEKKVESRFVLEFAYSDTNAVMQVIKALNVTVETRQFDLKCTLTVRVWNRRIEDMMKNLSQIGGCQVTGSQQSGSYELL